MIGLVDSTEKRQFVAKVRSIWPYLLPRVLVILYTRVSRE
jgi:hypothetical protein